MKNFIIKHTFSKNWVIYRKNNVLIHVAGIDQVNVRTKYPWIKIVPAQNRLAVVGNVWYHVAGANPFWTDMSWPNV